MTHLFVAYGEHKTRDVVIGDDRTFNEFSDAQTHADELNEDEGEDGAYTWKVGRVVPATSA